MVLVVSQHLQSEPVPKTGTEQHLLTLKTRRVPAALCTGTRVDAVISLRATPMSNRRQGSRRAPMRAKFHHDQASAFLLYATRTRSNPDTSRTEAGFTLIELAAVLLIMAILLAIAIPRFLDASGTASEGAAQSNLSTAVSENHGDVPAQPIVRHRLTFRRPL